MLYDQLRFSVMRLDRLSWLLQQAKRGPHPTPSRRPLRDKAEDTIIQFSISIKDVQMHPGHRAVFAHISTARRAYLLLYPRARPCDLAGPLGSVVHRSDALV